MKRLIILLLAPLSLLPLASCYDGTDAVQMGAIVHEA